MSQIFHRSTNLLSRLSIYGGVFILSLLGFALYEIELSSWYTDVNVAQEQPVPFSHKHHVGELGLDCRYCHTSVEKSSFAGIPPTHTCMTCHSQIWTNAAMLEPVRASYRDDKSIAWTRVNALPEFVYFDHSIHVAKGVGCTTCHGPIAKMPLTWRAESLYMSWCLNCHRQPEEYVRPKEKVFDPNYEPPANQHELGVRLVKEYKIQKLTNCSTCHR
ncbi:MAG TPA: cytochrome c3 family protein [Candidatus Limnocylindrales bacterium]|jgi:cytochrome c7-like protein|nr:cytochrome c3 family protein [Candidatus Limnocylindrales bacterium]